MTQAFYTIKDTLHGCFSVNNTNRVILSLFFTQFQAILSLNLTPFSNINKIIE